MTKQHRSITPAEETDDEVELIIDLIAWMNRWGSTLRDIAAHPEKYPLPAAPRRGRPPKEAASSTIPA